jgi:hypothetical protein
VGVNLFLVEFEHVRDKLRVINGRPWVFKGSLFSVKDFVGITPPSKIVLDKVAFWVRMYNPLA